MAYRLTKDELRIIEQTKREGEFAHSTDNLSPEENAPATTDPINDRFCDSPPAPDNTETRAEDKPPGLMAIFKPYIFFTGMILAILVAIAILLTLTP